MASPWLTLKPIGTLNLASPTAALHWLASDDEKRLHLLVAMAKTSFRRDIPDAEAAKLLLYESSQLQPPSVYGLLALGARLLTEDISQLSSYQQLANECQLQRKR